MIYSNNKLYAAVITIAINLTFAASANCQSRIQEIEQGIALIDKSKQDLSTILSDLGFNFQKSSSNTSTYLKRGGLGSNTLNISYLNHKVNTLSWTEYIAHLQNILSELKSDGFENYQAFNNVRMYGFRNIKRNIMLTLIVRTASNDVVITVGKIRHSDPVIKLMSGKAPVNAQKISQTYVCVSQKAFLYQMIGGVGRRTNNFVKEGQLLKPIKDNGGYILAALPTANKKTVSGWMCKCDLEIASDTISQQINTIAIESPDRQLLGFDNVDDVKKAYNNPSIMQVLKNIMGHDYIVFAKDFLDNSITGDVRVRHDVLYIQSFVIHNATSQAYLLIDLKSKEGKLYWVDSKDQVKIYGAKSLVPNINKFIKAFTVSNKEYVEESTIEILNQFAL
jgi:hypothetical protein